MFLKHQGSPRITTLLALVLVNLFSYQTIGLISANASPSVGSENCTAIIIQEYINKLKKSDANDPDIASLCGSKLVPSLVKILKHESWVVRIKAAESLGSMGIVAKPAIPALIEAVGDEIDLVKDEVVFALFRIESETKIAVPATITDLKNPDDKIRANAAEVLGRIGEDSPDTVHA